MSIGMKGREIDFIPDRLIEEPVVFRGMTDTEVVTLMGLSLAFWVPVTVLMLMPFDMALFGTGIGFGLSLLSLLVIGSKLQDLKRRMPDGIHIVYIKKTLQQKTPFSFGYINQSGLWDIRRDWVVKRIIFDTDE
ncbi:MAG: TIGR03750 family conjugal transfer protein [Maribacter sp.]|nr:TIGR03750 family conjugal transfer protein [Maribacter sp.]